MKYKFSKFAYEAVTHVINLMTKLMAGMYMNTKAVFDVVHPNTEEDAADSDTVEETTDEQARGVTGYNTPSVPKLHEE
ncbi:hypothetical protein PPTG_23650 [Phytophthora nicotianae INRA-310]|uniref:Uncharacterized protein n=2 Tax=Phytophthora nicotianae TaxID=4792 RepID=W2PVH9_PHYN3|nr:hypothetical protein PPTG_23650 [Phytophthora nicotianae INRA-310]ETI29820.1 hypothetical protein F443_23065 [Phytophthora nicotianae P1569]ETN04229.1 hypothetical protein PPTG_23650 [Phytophthora nicotianae INRA-310]